MLVSKSIFHKLFFIIVFSALSTFSYAQSNEWNDLASEKMKEIDSMEERMQVIESYLLNVENLTEQEKGWLRENFDLKVRMYLAANNEKTLSNLSTKVFDNTMCLARGIGPKALVYINVALDQLFVTPEEEKRYIKANKFLETLETPEYTEQKIKDMCNL